ncbi:MAG: bile acid:sodium symporter family protein [Actinomycetota bacterium]
MQTAIDVTIQIFVVSTMLALGLQVPPARIARGVRDWRTITTGSLLNLVIIPALGLLAASGLDLGAEIRTGYLLIAFSPGAPYAVKLIAIARGEVASSIGLIITLQLAGLVSVPVLTRIFIDSAAGLEIPQLLAAILLLQLVPLVVGLIGQGKKWMGSPSVTRAIGALSNASFGILVVLILIHDFPRVVRILDVPVLTAVVGLIVASLTTGALFAGHDATARRSLGLISAARKGGLALVIATSTFGGDAEAVIMIVAYALIELVLLTMLAAWWRASG